MTYTTIHPPFTLDFRAMPRAELREYFAWLMKVLPERVAMLESAVREAAASWNANASPDSLAALVPEAR